MIKYLPWQIGLWSICLIIVSIVVACTYMAARFDRYGLTLYQYEYERHTTKNRRW